MDRLTVRLGSIGGAMLGEVSELPGCIASGETVDELLDNLRVLIRLTFDGGGAGSPADMQLPIAGMASTGAGCTVWLGLERPLDL